MIIEPRHVPSSVFCCVISVGQHHITQCLCDSSGGPSQSNISPTNSIITVYPKKYAHGFCFAVLCCGYTLPDFPISIRLTSLALWQSNDCPNASKATLMNMDKYFMWIHYERLHNHNKAKHNKTVCIFLGIYCNTLGPLLLTWINFNSSMDKQLHALYSVKGNYSSIPKLQQFHHTLNWSCDWSSMLGLKLINVSKGAPEVPVVECKFNF